MPKKLRNYPIYVAPDIKGYLDSSGQPIVFDERTQRNLDPNDIDDKITIYERQVKEWFLNRASRFLRGNKNGFIVLMLSISYIEGVEQYRQGTDSNRNSRNFFTRGLRRIFGLANVTNTELDDFYIQVRCGLFHNGMTQSKVIINRNYNDPIDFSEADTIKINQKEFLRIIRIDFKEYLRDLREPNNIQLRNNFNAMYSNF